jgi:Holliday junction resolvase RusA-like endonuclease
MGAVVTHGAKSKQWEGKVREALAGLDPLAGPLTVELWFWVQRPSSVTRPYPSVVPDIDKLTRAVLDGMKGAIEDDSRVVDLEVHERYATEEIGPGVFVYVYERPDDREIELGLVRMIRAQRLGDEGLKGALWEI